MTSVTFNFVIYCLILGNALTLSLYRYDQSEAQADLLVTLDIFFVWVFTVEMVMKLIGLGFKNYIMDKFNIFDAIIVIVSLVDFSLTMSGTDQEGGIFSAFRAMRIIRVVKLARKWEQFRKVLVNIVASVKAISSFSLLLFIFMFILALLGMEMFAYSVAFDINGDKI